MVNTSTRIQWTGDQTIGDQHIVENQSIQHALERQHSFENFDSISQLIDSTNHNSKEQIYNDSDVSLFNHPETDNDMSNDNIIYQPNVFSDAEAHRRSSAYSQFLGKMRLNSVSACPESLETIADVLSEDILERFLAVGRADTEIYTTRPYDEELLGVSKSLFRRYSENRAAAEIFKKEVDKYLHQFPNNTTKQHDKGLLYPNNIENNNLSCPSILLIDKVKEPNLELEYTTNKTNTAPFLSSKLNPIHEQLSPIELTNETYQLIPKNSAGELTSIGSVNHITGECRPCAFFNNPKKQGCSNGIQCAFCHFEHPKKKKAFRQSKAERILKRELNNGTDIPNYIPLDTNFPGFVSLGDTDLGSQNNLEQLSYNACSYNNNHFFQPEQPSRASPDMKVIEKPEIITYLPDSTFQQNYMNLHNSLSTPKSWLQNNTPLTGIEQTVYPGLQRMQEDCYDQRYLSNQPVHQQKVFTENQSITEVNRVETSLQPQVVDWPKLQSSGGLTSPLYSVNQLNKSLYLPSSFSISSDLLLSPTVLVLARDGALQYAKNVGETFCGSGTMVNAPDPSIIPDDELLRRCEKISQYGNQRISSSHKKPINKSVTEQRFLTQEVPVNSVYAYCASSPRQHNANEVWGTIPSHLAVQETRTVFPSKNFSHSSHTMEPYHFEHRQTSSQKRSKKKAPEKFEKKNTYQNPEQDRQKLSTSGCPVKKNVNNSQINSTARKNYRQNNNCFLNSNIPQCTQTVNESFS